PFFLLAGKLMNTGGITTKIFKFANELVGWIPGGLGIANIFASIIFAGMSGSAVADAAGLGTIEIKAMEDAGFDTPFSAAVTAASSTVGPVIPPSVPLIMFGVMGGTSIASLLVAGIIPGILMGISMTILVMFIAHRRNYPRNNKVDIGRTWASFKEAFWPLLTPVILIGGMLSGIFTPTEAAVVAAIYALLLTSIFYRSLDLPGFMKICPDTVKDSSMILVIVGASSLYGYLLIKSQIPTYLMNKVFTFSQNPVVILFLINLFLLIIGCFMECNAAIMILTPILVPMCQAVGIDSVHLGVIMVLNLMIGLLTPPIGMCLFTTARVANITLDKMIKEVMPFYIPLVIVLLMVTYIPDLVLFLPRLVL
ncbi:MAG: TRAP transporter large permease, partial [Clostridiales bacterium]|nr:TRAP transporter large permease [Clostridiales bacterium]